MRNNENYGNLEFVLLDYNSIDGLQKYVQSNLFDYIKSGRLKYYKITEPKYFHRSHSRNLVFKLASGELICNIDADNYTGKGFASFINSEFHNRQAICLNTMGLNNSAKKKDVLGRICVRKKDFLTIKGYDEYMESYGFEDYDFINRLELSGIRSVLIKEENFLRALAHSNELRTSEEYIAKAFSQLFIRYIEPSLSEVVILLADKNFFKGTIIDNYAKGYSKPTTSAYTKVYQYDYSLLENQWISGIWEQSENNISLKNLDACLECISKKMYRMSGNTFYKIDHPALIQEVIFFFSQLTNREKMGKNKRENRIVVNEGKFGSGTVYKNFNDSEPILIDL